jgi:hypothetical protein
MMVPTVLYARCRQQRIVERHSGAGTFNTGMVKIEEVDFRHPPFSERRLSAPPAAQGGGA